MEKLGFGPEELSEIRPGIIYLSINCYGFDGPFSDRGGWEQVAQIMTGLTTIESTGSQTKSTRQVFCQQLQMIILPGILAHMVRFLRWLGEQKRVAATMYEYHFARLR